MKFAFLFSAFAFTLFQLSSPAMAADAGGDDEDAAAKVDEPAEETDAEGEADSEDTAEDDSDDTDDTDESEEEDSGDADKDEKVEPAHYLIGGRYRVAVVPQFLINAFGVDGGRTPVVQGGGPEFAFSQKDFEIILSPWFAGYALERTPFKGPNDGADAWEIIQSNLNVAYISADFLWKKEIAKGLDFTIGAGAGIGIVFGTMARNEAYWSNAGGGVAPLPGNGDPYNTNYAAGPVLTECIGPGNPATAQCPINGEYGPFPAWPVYPWLTFQTGLRYSPVKQLITRLDLGAGATGFWFGLAVDYGI